LANAHPDLAQGTVIPHVPGIGKANPASFDRKAKSFFVPLADIEAAKFDLSISRYKEVVHEEVRYDAPQIIIGRLRKLEAEIAGDLEELEGMLK
jgi:type I restriction enzyme M protein